MNERLRELIDECTEWITGTIDGDIECFDKEKFAELMVRKCMDIIADESEKVSDEWRCKDGKHIWWKIKEHFGVE